MNLPAFARDDASGMLLLTDATAPAGDLGLKRELTTARDYARYVRDHHGETFVYASRYRGTFVPVFDGFVLGPGGEARRNVSLKFDSLVRARPSTAALLKSVRARLNNGHELRRTESFNRWVAAVNLWPPNRGVDAGDSAEVARARELWDTFGLGAGRPLTIVVDLRTSGFTYDHVGEATVRRALGEIAPAGRLSLVWDHARVIEL